jgi:hypothetical protein
MWQNHFSQLFSVREVSDLRQTKIHTAKPLVPQPNTCEVEMAVEKLKRHNSLDIEQIPAELIKTKGRNIHSGIPKLKIISGIRRSCLRSGRRRSLYLSIRRTIKQNVAIMEAYHFCQLHTKFYPTSCCQGQLHMQRKLMGTTSVDSDATGQLLIIYSAFVKYLRK